MMRKLLLQLVTGPATKCLDYDTTDHEIILKKLSKYGVDQDTLKWFKSYLTNRIQRCNVNNHLSSANPLNCGVPQGSIIGPLLFLICINDLPNYLNVGSRRMYADDTNVTFLQLLYLILSPKSIVT